MEATQASLGSTVGQGKWRTKLTGLVLMIILLEPGGVFGGVQVTQLYAFTGGMDGQFPMAPLLQAADGALYGTTDYGGLSPSISGYGTAFKLTLDGTFTALYAFGGSWDGQHPGLSGLVEDADGFLYGTTMVGGDYQDGTVFVVTPDGFEFPVYSFSPYGGDGAGPEAGVSLAVDGSLYGTTAEGGDRAFGTVFRVDSYWDYARLFSFNGTNGATPHGPLLQARDGNLYGTTFAGGPAFQGRDNNGNPTGYGTVFRISTNGVFSTLFSFGGTNGAQPIAQLVQGPDGGLYGTTQIGGAAGYGTIYKITTNGVFSLLFSFTGPATGGYPVGRLALGQDGNFYGTTADLPFINGNGAPHVGNGTIFRLTPAGEFTRLYSFPGRPGGVEPLAGLVQASDGNFYGTCLAGTNGVGMLFRLSIPAAPVLQIPQKSQAGMNLSWTAVPGQNYQVQFKNDLGANVWSNLGSVITATNAVMSTLDPAPLAALRFYHVVLLP